MIKIVVTGAECSGKTTLASNLAKHYNAGLAPEYARTYLSELDRPYEKSDLKNIAIGQLQSEQELSHNEILICDTSLLVLTVWSEVKYGSIHPWLTVLYEDAHPDLYILPDWNIPYEADPLREHPEDRMELHNIYVNKLNEQSSPWMSVIGTPEERLKQAVKRIDFLILEASQ